jgi:hypothetical protein
MEKYTRTRQAIFDKILLRRKMQYVYVVPQAKVQAHTFITQGDNKVSVHPMITIQKVTNNVHSVPRQSPDIY